MDHTANALQGELRQKPPSDSHWHNLIPLLEHVNVDTGASTRHETGWPALMAKLLQELGESAEALPKPSRVEQSKVQPRARRAVGTGRRREDRS